MRFRFIVPAFLCIAMELANPRAWAQEDFYRGKQLRLVVSTDPGGAYDTYARLLAPIMRDYVPGNPNIIVQNMPGASGLKAANYMGTNAPRDGTVIASTHAGILTAQLASPDAATFDANRLSWIGSITTTCVDGTACDFISGPVPTGSPMLHPAHCSSPIGGLNTYEWLTGREASFRSPPKLVN